MEAIMLSRRSALTLAATATIPRFAIAQSDSRPSITVAVQKIATSATLETLREQSNVGTRIFSSFLETMIGVDWTGSLKQRPLLATAWRRIDDRTLELTLREGVKFHNGATLAAEDVAFSFGNERMWSGSKATASGMFVSNTAGANTKLPPPEAAAIAKSAYPGFERIEIVNPTTVRFINGSPDVTLEARLTRNTGVIISQKGFDASANWLDWARKPVGTGPYKVRVYHPDQDLILDAHDDYWGGRPPLKSIRFVEVPEVSGRVNGLLSGDYDFACDLPPDQIPMVESSARHQVVGGKINNIRLSVFDKNNPAMANPLVRRAMTHAIDRQGIVDSLWQSRTAIPRGLQFEFFGPMYLADWEAPKFDLDLARSLLKQANYKGDPIEYQLLNNYYTNQTPGAQVMVEGWRQAGLNVNIAMKENWSQILGHFPERGICDNSNTAWFGDPVACLAAIAPGGQTWEAGQWRNDEVPPVMATLQNSTDMEMRRKAARRLMEIAEREDPGYSVLYQNANFTGKRRDIGWKAGQSFIMDFGPGNWGVPG
jgi:peptide/nickel transport system substrate-binding protein